LQRLVQWKMELPRVPQVAAVAAMVEVKRAPEEVARQVLQAPVRTARARAGSMQEARVRRPTGRS
ncbi:MAG TPA: hypothetical protein VHO25_18995, partial [Polyangiaceae bacterium]|nr:hypothetical protein [Polyangiaceae bacterium]